MPKELLDLIKSLNEFKKQESIDDFEEFLQSINKPREPEFTQYSESYKVRHLDGTITVMDLRSVDLAQIKSHSILLSWDSNEIELTLEAIGKDEFKRLADFLTQ